MFDTSFNHITSNHISYYPDHLQTEIDQLNEFIYNDMNNGVYKSGFSTSQSIYETHVKQLFKTLDKLEARLSKQRYLLGDTITEADWRLFPTLYRFDTIYSHFKCNLKHLQDYENLWNYTLDLYQTLNLRDTCNMDHIKQHYYTSHAAINPNQIVPLGPVIDFTATHSRC